MRILVLLSVLMVSLCIPAQSKTVKKLIGTWRWIETSGGFAGMITTPQSENKEIGIQFTAKGMHMEIENGKVIYSRPYRIEKAPIPKGELTEFIVHGSKKDMRQQKQSEYFEFRGKDTLVIMPNCADCYTRVFVRKK
jgi:hypothetical protein